MLCPERMAAMAASTTGCGGSVSHTPCARLMPPASEQATLIERISDCVVWGARSLRRRAEAEETAAGMEERPEASFHLMAAGAVSVGGAAPRCGPAARGSQRWPG